MNACLFCWKVLARHEDIDRGACVECRHAIWLVLAEECGAIGGRGEFMHHFPRCVEFRFCAALGFGGKVYWTNHRLYVSCYPEDRTPERDAAVERTNARLAELVKPSEQEAS